MANVPWQHGTVAEAKFPVDAHPTALSLISLDFEMATPAGLSLNEKVGLTESFFIKRFLRFPICVPKSSANCKGVKPACMFTMQSLSAIGNQLKITPICFVGS